MVLLCTPGSLTVDYIGETTILLRDLVPGKSQTYNRYLHIRRLAGRRRDFLRLIELCAFEDKRAAAFLKMTGLAAGEIDEE